MVNVPENGWFLGGLLIAMFGLFELGRRVGKRRLAADPSTGNSGQGPIEGAVFALLGLLLAFTFSGSTARFDTRRQLIVQETSAVQTAWLRTELLDSHARDTLRAELRNYVDARLAVTHSDDTDGAARDKVSAIQNSLWEQAVNFTEGAAAGTNRSLLLPSLNDMFSVVTARSAAMHTHVPWTVFIMVFVLMLACSLLAGFGMAASKQRSWLHIICFGGTLALTVCVIWDMEFPRRGFIRLDEADQLLIGLRATLMK